MKTTIKEIKNFYCEDITHISEQDARKITKKEIIAYSHGTYGITGIVFIDIFGHLFKITARNSNLFTFL